MICSVLIYLLLIEFGIVMDIRIRNHRPISTSCGVGYTDIGSLCALLLKFLNL